MPINHQKWRCPERLDNNNRKPHYQKTLRKSHSLPWLLSTSNAGARPSSKCMAKYGIDAIVSNGDGWFVRSFADDGETFSIETARQTFRTTSRWECFWWNMYDASPSPPPVSSSHQAVLSFSRWFHCNSARCWLSALLIGHYILFASSKWGDLRLLFPFFKNASPSFWG